MKIHERTEETLLIFQPDLAHKAQAIIFTVIGAIGSLGVFFSGEGLYNGIIAYLIFILGIFFFIVGGKPDRLQVDRKSGTLVITEHKKLFGDPEIRSILLFDIASCQLDSSRLGGGSFQVGNRMGYAIILKLQNGEDVWATPYTSRKHRCEAVFTEFVEFTGLTDSSS